MNGKIAVQMCHAAYNNFLIPVEDYGKTKRMNGFGTKTRRVTGEAFSSIIPT